VSKETICVVCELLAHKKGKNKQKKEKEKD
jgi:hypothetical protein